VIDMPNEFMEELADKIPNVSAVKQARMDDIEPIPGLELLAGNDDKLAEVLDKGGAGGITVSSHVVGNEMRRMIDEPDARWEIQEQIADVIDTLMTLTSSPIPLKAALNMLGHDVGGLRLPLVEASEEENAAIRAMLERHGLLSAV
jgi:4-hydroxy-tetrahydrodipicolinate synthase